jgi:hypothetical protein
VSYDDGELSLTRNDDRNWFVYHPEERLFTLGDIPATWLIVFSNSNWQYLIESDGLVSLSVVVFFQITLELGQKQRGTRDRQLVLHGLSTGVWTQVQVLE